MNELVSHYQSSDDETQPHSEDNTNDEEGSFDETLCEYCAKQKWKYRCPACEVRFLGYVMLNTTCSFKPAA
jgi:hypothetical protein